MILRVLLGAALSAALVGPAAAAVSADEAKLLGTSLTAFGAEKAGNADGSIPAYSAAATKITPPAGADPAKGVYPNPFADEKPLFSITPQNADQYKGKLNEGNLALFKRWPDYRMDVYKTHRTAPYPDWVLKNTQANATQAKLVNEQGDGVEGAYGGIPFPIPKNGLEVLWNHFLYWQPVAMEGLSPGYLMDASGALTNLQISQVYYEAQYYNPDNAALDGAYFKLKSTSVGPPRSVGEGNLAWYSMDYSKITQKAWSYAPGQRRVRLAPEFTYDTPAAPYGGALFYDEIFLFSGRPDRFDWKLVGKKEMYVPYNAYDLVNSSPDQAMGPQHLNNARQRWELHRVWEVEATLKQGARHVFSKRKFYFDEDSWKIVLATGYDQAGEIYRTGNQNCYQVYDPNTPWMSCTFTIYDLAKGQYMSTPLWGGKNGFLRTVPLRPAAETTSGGLAGSGIR